MDRYITSQKLDFKDGKCFDKDWEETNIIKWNVYDKVIPKEYSFEIKVGDDIIGKAQIYDKKLWLNYDDSEHDKIKKWLTENSEEFIQTFALFKNVVFKNSLFGYILLKSYPKIDFQFNHESYSEIFDCHH